MPEYIYVQGKTIDIEDGAITFQHTRVIADDEEAAYLIGQRLLATSPFVTSKKRHEVINDYVIKEMGTE